MTYVIAHRGASSTHRENTLDAFRAAREQGADWVELDARRTADGVIAVHHDAHLADGRAIVELAADELPDHVPLLISALEACEGMGVNIEIKNDPNEPDYDAEHLLAEGVAALVLSLGAQQSVLVTSFNMDAIGRLRAVEPTIPTGWLTFDLAIPAQALERTVAHGHVAINPYVGFVDGGLVQAAHDVGLRVYPWTVDDPDRIAELIGLGVDGVITNVPAVARKLVDELTAP